MLKSGLGPAAVLLLAVACVLLRPTAPPVSHQGSAAGGGGQQAVGGTCGGKRTQPQAGCYSRPRPTPNSTTAAPAAATGVAATPGSGPPQGALLSQPAGDGLYIVRFRQYRMAADHLAALQAALAYGSPPDSWQWVERHNPAAAFPTDFGLLRLAAPEAALKSRLEQLPFVKGVHPERRLTRSLLAAPEPGAEQQEEHAQDAAAADAARPGTQFAPCSSSSSGGVGSLEQACASKRQGRLQTRPTFSLEDNLSEEEEELADALSARIGNDTFTPESSQQRRLRRRLQGRRRRQLLQQGTLASILQADSLWAQGFRGQGVKMGVFDTGIKGDHPDVKHIVERSNWTHEPTLDDGLGHGSFVAGVIAGTEPTCPGLAPEVSLYTFRVFTNDQVSYTSWFLDAFNYAIASRMNVVNLSIGGPDYLDEPFAEKVAEITSAGIIMVSAIGNDGPLYGTLNNPADQNDVIGIGGIDYSDQIAPFSSRGMSTWEVPLGYGRSKPDVMAYGRDVQGSKIGGGCRSLSGTSVASPVVAGAVCLLASVVPEEKRWQLLNPASMKQALVEGAVRLPGLNLYEQGAGKLSVVNSKAVLEQYVPRASLVPASLNFTDCPYMWPFCRQPLYATAMPLMFNATILNGLGLTGRLEGAPAWTPADDGGRLLDVRFEYSEQLWPWSGYLALFIRVRDEGAAFQGSGGGEVAFTVVSPPAPGEAAPRRSTVRVPLTVGIIPTPDRKLRLLWDQFHSIRYPPAYFPRDDLQARHAEHAALYVRHDILDWHGDHPHTNYHDMFNALRDEGFFLEVLASPATCFNASLYGSLLVVDSEDEWYPEEVAKLAADVEGQGLGLLVFADWYHLESIQRLRFYDDNTRSWWEAATGGANVPALNDMLTPYGVAFESGALEVEVHIKGVQGPFHMASGVPLKTLPVGSWMHRADPKPGDGELPLPPSTSLTPLPRCSPCAAAAQSPAPGFPVLGLLQHGAGRVGLYGDSNCLDSSHSRSKCFKLLIKMAAWAAGEVRRALPRAAPPRLAVFGCTLPSLLQPVPRSSCSGRRCMLRCLPAYLPTYLPPHLPCLTPRLGAPSRAPRRRCRR
ncbi:hypothetical protein CHLNCDRAFT_33771 [Chlorella variabilis]|uniref:Uncharacterized protein n=1 Tax=Chlorella variabilis TaxID=554065 RepID=E1Z495_CHLVA|nr:hypothetical protein CHLNCDRAFT_33771 [Chlorella variabilis]EFN59013.1 hypothetical protein CHLNCDRAFT_33771 [Chlorella variabilis]|eukprot:XP_005851115.1 hypothetical protein CHLNCDRAFT_33771 [Chlorella variabilis]